MVKSKGSKTKERNKGNHSLTTSLYIGVIVAEWLFFFFIKDIYYYNYKELLKKKIITMF